MSKRFVPSALILPALLMILLAVACSEDNPTEVVPVTLQVPDEYTTIAAAAQNARAGDCIVVEANLSVYEEDIVLPADVSLKAYVNTGGFTPDFPRIAGEVTMLGGRENAYIEGFIIENSAGNGITVVDATVQIRDCWLRQCGGAGIALSGFSPAIITNCDLDSCATGILIHDIGPGEGGHYNRDVYEENRAAKISDCNFLDNGDPLNSRHIVFQNVTAGDTIKVTYNHWRGVDLDDTSQDGIIDVRDDDTIFGLADTEVSNFATWPNIKTRDWRD